MFYYCYIKTVIKNVLCFKHAKSSKFYLQMARRNLTPSETQIQLKQQEIYRFFSKISVFVSQKIYKYKMKRTKKYLSNVGIYIYFVFTFVVFMIKINN